MSFSGALTLTDLNDFITPSQACIKPVTQTNPTKSSADASTEIHVDSAGSYYEVSDAQFTGGQKLQQAQINLNDCLACSGCITSAESVLITLQSHTEVLNFLASNSPNSPNYKIPIISIAPQSLASLAASLSSSSHSEVSPTKIMRRLRKFFNESMGCADVFDTNFARHLVLKDHVREFNERKDSALEGTPHQLPMLASACPGWICYAEKTHAEMLPFIARTKSPQQVMGSLVKDWIAGKYGLSPSDVYHVTVMPCYDKKLEASRSDFYNELYSSRDVDCVITTGELDLLLKERKWDITVPVPGESDPLPPTLEVPTLSKNGHTWTRDMQLPELIQHPGSSSGSYLHVIIDHLVSVNPGAQLVVKPMRNADHVEYILKLPSQDGSGPDQVIFKGAKCYGFRNLQNVVRKIGKEQGLRVATGAAGKLAGARTKGGGIRKGKNADSIANDRPYDYVEVMACPGGCVNGGGQLKPVLRSRDTNIDTEGYQRQWEESGVQLPQSEDGRWGDKEWTKRVEAAYWTTSSNPSSPSRDHHLPPGVENLEKRILQDLSHDPVRRAAFFRTGYRAVENEVVGLAVQW